MEYMTKYDYLSILSTFNERQYRIFNTISQNDEYASVLIYNAMIEKVAGASEIFLNNQDLFVQWLSSYPLTGQSVSILDSEVIGFLDRNKDFTDFYKGSTEEINHIMHFLIVAWTNKTKTLKQNLNKLQMLYQRYIKFIMSDKGQDFLYGKSLDLIPDFDSTLAYEDKPFYEQQAYKQKQLLKLKKHTLSNCCKSAMENCEMMALWDITFSNKGEKFSYIKCRERVRKFITENAVSDTQLYYHLKRLRVIMMQYILDNYDNYLDDFVIYDSHNQLVHIKEVLQDWLIQSKNDFEKSKYSCNKRQLTNSKIADTVAKWCDIKGVRYKYGTGKVLVKLKINADMVMKKSWKLFIFKGGGWYCHSTGQNGFITDIIPLSFFFPEEVVPIKVKKIKK